MSGESRKGRGRGKERENGNFTSDGGFKVARYETTSIGETLMGSPSVRHRPDPRAIPGDFAFHPDMGNYVGNTEHRRTFFIMWKIKLLHPLLLLLLLYLYLHLHLLLLLLFLLLESRTSEHFNEVILEF